MNKQRFIERLNLHLDGELSELETEELFKAMRRNEEYQRIYAQYCQIYSACTQLGETFVGDRRGSPARQKLYAIGGMAAAVALLGLAAVNLAPVIGGQQQGVVAQSVFEADGTFETAQLTNEVSEERFVVLNIEELRSKPFLFNNVELASFDVEAAFASASSAPASTRAFSYVSARVEKPLAETPVRWERPFMLEKGLPASTFEHEVLGARDSAMSAFSRQSPLSGSAAAGVGEVRFDLRRAEGQPARWIETQASAATAK